QDCKEVVGSDDVTESLQRHRAAFVHGCGEEIRPAGITDSQPPEGLHAQGCYAERIVETDALLVCTPQPLRIRGEALVEPHVLHTAEADAVAEPLVGVLVNDRRTRWPVTETSEQPCAIDRPALLLQSEGGPHRDDHPASPAERVRAETV